MKNLTELKKTEETMDFKTAKRLFSLLPSTMKMQVFINSGTYLKGSSIDIQSMNINPIQALFFLAGIDAECKVRVVVYDNSFEFALAYNEAAKTETEQDTTIYTEEQEAAMYGESHFIQMLEATKDLF